MTIKMIFKDNFYDDIVQIKNIVSNLRFEPNKFGQEIMNFNLVDPTLEPVFRSITDDGTLVIIDELSGVFRRPDVNIHFEDFAHPLDWCFTVAVEETHFQLYKHVETGIESALENHMLNTINFLQWDCVGSMILRPNQCVFFRPWMYHSFLGGMTKHYILRHVDKPKEVDAK